MQQAGGQTGNGGARTSLPPPELIKAESASLLKLFSVVVVSVSYVTSQVSIFAATHGSIFILFQQLLLLVFRRLTFVIANVCCLVCLTRFLSRRDLMRQTKIGKNV